MITAVFPDTSLTDPIQDNDTKLTSYIKTNTRM